MVPCIIVVRDNVVSENILCRDGEHAKTVFLAKLAECLSNWDEYDQKDIDAILDDGYEQFGTGSVCLSWATSPDEEELPFGGSHAPDCPHHAGGECLCWRSDPKHTRN